MNERMNIEELVRSKLEGQEIAPSRRTWSRILRRVRRAQFMRFDPGRFNVYYAAGILVAGAGLIALIQTGPGEVQTEARAPGQTALPGERTAPAPAENKIIQVQPKPGDPSLEVAPSEAAEDVKPAAVPEEAREEAAEATSGDGTTGEKQSGISREPALPEEADRKEPVHNTLVAFFTPSVTSGCAPLTVQFFNQSVNHLSVTWRMGTTEPVTGENPEHTFTKPGTHHVTMTAMGEGGQTASFSQVIEVYPVPAADFIIEEGLPDSEGQRTYSLINCSSGADSYRWNLMGENKTELRGWSSDAFSPDLPVSAPNEKPRHIRLVATNEYGCSQTAVRELPEAPDAGVPGLTFPTAFSPNTTGPAGGLYSPHEKRNDVFHPLFDTEPLEYRLRIYSRRGVLVFESTDIYRGWDGYYQQERAAAGVYVWMAEGTWRSGEEFRMQGDVTLIWSDGR